VAERTVRAWWHGGMRDHVNETTGVSSKCVPHDDVAHELWKVESGRQYGVMRLSLVGRG
jgi:hypothetical protein